MHRSSISISLLLCLLLAACTKPDKNSENGESTFIVKEASGNGEPQVEKNSPLNIPSVVKFGFQVCLDDRANRKEIRNQDFYISVPGETRGWDRKTTKYGCLNFEDEMAYDHLAGQSGWVRRKYVIQGRGVNTGSETVEFALNPWAAGDDARDRGKAVIYLRDGDSGLIPHLLADTKDSNAYLAGIHDTQKNKAQMIIQDVKVKAIKEGEGNDFETLTYIITANPKIKVTNSNGVVTYKPAPDGDYNLWMMLTAAQVGPGMDQRVGILAGQPFSVAKVIAGHLQAELHIRQDKMANWSNLELAMRVVPQSISGRTSIAEFNGIISLGAGILADDGGGVVALKCLEENNSACSFDKVLASLRNSADLEKAGYIRPVEAFTFSNLKLRFLMVQPGETATQRTVAYTASVCIRETRTGKPLAYTPMTIRYLKNPNSKGSQQDQDAERPTIPQTTDASGCLNWDGQAFHRYYQPEEYFERSIVIEKLPSFTKAFKFYINPWDTNINFGFDAREFTADRIEQITTRTKIPSRFFLGGYQYHTVRFLYNIDPFMDLEVKKTVLMELVPEVLRYSGIKDARKMTEHLRDGIYLLKVGIQKSYLDPRDNSGLMLENSEEVHDKEGNKVANPMTPLPGESSEDFKKRRGPDFGRTYPRMKGEAAYDANDPDGKAFKGKDSGLKQKEFITTTTTLVRVVSGLIIVPIELTMRDLRLMRVRSNFLIELQTVDERMIQAWQVFSDRAIQKENLVEELKNYRQTLTEAKPVKYDENGHVVPWSNEYLDNMNPELKKLQDQRTVDGKAVAGEGDMNIEKREKMRKAYESLESKVLRTQQAIQDSLAYIKRRFQEGGVLGNYLNSQGKKTELPYEILQDATINDNFELSEDLVRDLRGQLQVNDFSKVKLPTAKDVDDLDIFVERDSGLQERTFVGPVIFLSNAYSDSARATDNLDEEFGGRLCRANSLKQKDANGKELNEEQKARLERSYTLQESMEELAANSAENKIRAGDGSEGNGAAFESENRWRVGPSNNATRYSKYYGSLSHLCFKQVDDLIAEEKRLNRDRENRMLRVSLKSNFLDYSRRVLNIPLQYVSLTDEPLQEISEECPAEDVRQCLHKSSANTIPAKKIKEWVEPGLAVARHTLNWQPYNIVKWWRGQETQSSRDAWDPKDYHSLFFEKNNDTKVGLCNLLANKIGDQLADRNLMPRGVSLVQNRVLSACTKDGGLAHDIKLHIGKTGEYTFLGGMNLNINVGESFSTSWSHSWGAGVEFADFIGTPVSWGTGWAKGVGSKMLAGAGAGVGGLMVKPVNLKVGWGLSDSEGTSISESTYLVSQVAGFKLNLEQYEKCAVVALSSQARQSIENGWGLPDSGGAEGAIMGPQGPDFDEIEADFRSGLFVCEGATRNQNPPKEVKEMYFYFTQHFTEGDMLDQADLYNHPWLLAMRGMRDFMVFVAKVRGDYVVDLGQFVKGMTGISKPHQKAWALDHMAKVYQQVLPTFPGFYTVLDERDDIKFLLEQNEGEKLLNLRKTDTDPLGEIKRTIGPEGGGFGTYRRPNTANGR